MNYFCRRYGVLALGLLVGLSIPIGAQQTIQYDSGFGAGTPTGYPSSRVVGNCFTGLDPAYNVTRMSAYIDPQDTAMAQDPNVFWVFDGCQVGDSQLLVQVVNAAGNGPQTLSITGLNLNFTGTSLFAGARGFLSSFGTNHRLLFLDTGGVGTHIQAVAGNSPLASAPLPAGAWRNAEVRITGPLGLPVELLTIEVE